MPKIQYETGVYVIENLVNGKVYVGGAYKSFDLRFRIHKRDLSSGRHGNQHLQGAWNLYGAESFRFVVIERCSTKICAERETHWIARKKATDRKYGYNKSPTGGSPLGVKHSDEYRRAVSERNLRMSKETKAKIGAASKGRRCSEENKKKQSETARKMWKDPNIRKKIIESNTGQKRTEETKRKISKAHMGKVVSEETKQKLREIGRQKKWSDEQRAKFIKTMTGRKRPQEVIDKIARANRGRKLSEEARRNISIAQKKRFERPEERERTRVWAGKKLSQEHKDKIRQSLRRRYGKLDEPAKESKEGSKIKPTFVERSLFQ